MTVIKKKTPRKDKINQPDAFISAANDAASWYSTHKKQVITTIAIGSAAILGIWGSMMLIDHSKSVASTSYFQVQKAMDGIVGSEQPVLTGISDTEKAAQPLYFGSENDKNNAIMQAIDKTLNENANNDVGQIARLRKAILLTDASKTKEAITVFNDYLAKSTEKDSLHYMVVERLGYAYELDGNLDSALAQFTVLASAKDKNMKEAALYHQGRIYVAKKDNAKAKELFQQVISGASDKDGAPSAFAKLAASQLAAID